MDAWLASCTTFSVEISKALSQRGLNTFLELAQMPRCKCHRNFQESVTKFLRNQIVVVVHGSFLSLIVWSVNKDPFLSLSIRRASPFYLTHSATQMTIRWGLSDVLMMWRNEIGLHLLSINGILTFLFFRTTDYRRVRVLYKALYHTVSDMISAILISVFDVSW